MGVRADAEGTIRVHVEVPAADPLMDHMLTDIIGLDPDLEITGITP